MAGLQDLAGSVAGWQLSLASAAAWLISGIVLMSSGLQHIFSPAEALLADLLAMVNLTVAPSLGFSLSGFLALLSMMSGILVALTGVYLIYEFGQMLMELIQ